MVARLVEKHGVRPHQKDAGKRHAHLPAAGQGAHIAIHHLLAEAEPVQNLARSPILRIAVEFLEARLRLAILFDDGVHFVGAVRIAHGVLQLAQFGGHGADRTRPFHHLGNRAAAGHVADILAEIADGYAAFDGDLAFIRLLFAGYHAEERRLAGAVRPDQADLVALQERGRSLDENDLATVLLADIFETNHEVRKKD